MRRVILPLLAAAFVLTATSCSKEEHTGDPAGTAMLNMYNEQNGKTLLDDSDIYINDAGNFISPSSCQLFMLGERSGLGAVETASLTNPAPEVAVMKGYGYVAVRGVVARRFPSHSVALPLDPDLDVNLLKFYVMGAIEDAELGTLGAVVKFVTAKPQPYWLPEWGSTPYRLDYTSKGLGEEVTVQLPGDNFEAELEGNGELTCEQQGRNLVFTLLDWPSYGSSVITSYKLRLRVGESYTEVFVEVAS